MLSFDFTGLGNSDGKKMYKSATQRMPDSSNLVGLKKLKLTSRNGINLNLTLVQYNLLRASLYVKNIHFCSGYRLIVYPGYMQRLLNLNE